MQYTSNWKKRIVLVARDQSPSSALRRLGIALGNRGWDVESFLGNGKSISVALDEILLAVRKSDVVLTGMSANEELAREERAAAREAMTVGVPFGFYCDTFGCHQRPWFAGFRSTASFLFHVNEDEAESARLLFPQADVVAPANPMWEEFHFPRLSYKEAREKLGVAADEKMILVAGHKVLMFTMPTVSVLVDALHDRLLDEYEGKWKVFLSLHPGDPQVVIPAQWQKFCKELQEKNPGLVLPEVPKMPNLYDCLSQFSGVPVRIITDNEIPVSDLIPGADLVVATASTTEIEAACQRKPVISFLTEITHRRNVVQFGKREWELCELGTSEEAWHDSDWLAAFIAGLLNPELNETAAMREAQQAVFPTPKKHGVALRNMIATLEKWARH